MYEIDFLPVEAQSKSGDAITVHWTSKYLGRDAVMVVDAAGHDDAGNKVIRHLRKHYPTDFVDLMVCTHPDADHLNGLQVIVETLSVALLVIHNPRKHARDVSDFSNIEAFDDLIAAAKRHGTQVEEAFAGSAVFGEEIIFLGPTQDFYEEKLREHLAEEAGKSQSALYGSAYSPLSTKSVGAVALSELPDEETLSDDVETGPRNDMSLITLLNLPEGRFLLTGDAGIPALEIAAEHYEAFIGPFENNPLNFFQAPHHGSRRNLGPTILNRVLGPIGRGFGTRVSFISSSSDDDKHPSPKVTNALIRRGLRVSTTEGQSIRHQHDAPHRDGWVSLVPLPPMREDVN